MTTPDLQESFQLQVEQHRKILYKVCNTYCREPGSREDLAQEILIQLWRAYPRFDGRAQFSTWMYRIALNVAISFFRRENTRALRLISDEQSLLHAPDETETQPDGIRLLHQFIDGLDALNKALILLYLDGNSYREMAEVLGISETSASTRINRLKDRMKHELGSGPKK